MWRNPLLPLLSIPHGLRAAVPVRVLSMDQIKLFKNYLYSVFKNKILKKNYTKNVNMNVLRTSTHNITQDELTCH